MWGRKGELGSLGGSGEGRVGAVVVGYPAKTCNASFIEYRCDIPTLSWIRKPAAAFAEFGLWAKLGSRPVFETALITLRQSALLFTLVLCLISPPLYPYIYITITIPTQSGVLSAMELGVGNSDVMRNYSSSCCCHECCDPFFMLLFTA
jgi:hypothetical protein